VEQVSVVAEAREWSAAIAVVLLAISLPNMVFRSKHPPPGPMADALSRHAFTAAPYLLAVAIVLLGLSLVLSAFA
jgi:hypothetical protein